MTFVTIGCCDFVKHVSVVHPDGLHGTLQHGYAGGASDPALYSSCDDGPHALRRCLSYGVLVGVLVLEAFLAGRLLSWTTLLASCSCLIEALRGFHLDDLSWPLGA